MPQQFDIVENRNSDRRSSYPFLIVLQHDRVSSIGSVVVAPLIESPSPVAGHRLHPSIQLHDRQYTALIEEVAAIPRQMLGPAVGSAESERYAIIAALDLLFTGI